jgi:4-hydroxy-tetrahydrodipicolinate reductase
MTAAKTIRVAFSGARGRMGRALLPGLRDAADISVVAEIEVDDDLTQVAQAAGAQVVIDFTTPAAALANARAILAAGAHGVIGTTGFTAADLESLAAEARSAERLLLIAPNFSLGMVLLQRFSVQAARYFPRVEILETHHEGKLDAPSGTALDTARRISAAGAHAGPTGGEPARGLDVGGVRVHSVRLNGIQARQEVHFGAPAEGLVIRHDAFDRGCYLPGVLTAVRALPVRAGSGGSGLLHGLETILDA